MKTTDLRQKNATELQTEVKELQRAYFGLRMQNSAQQLSNTASLRVARRAIARAKTILVQSQRTVQTAA